MKVIKYFFGRKISPQNINFLNRMQQSKVKSLQIKDFMIKNICHHNWFICTQAAKATNLFHIYKDVWRQVILKLSLEINSEKQYSFKQMYYLTKFLYQINYEPMIEFDSKYIAKVSKYYQDPRFILLLSSLTISAQQFPKSMTKFQSDIIQMLKINRSLHLNRIIVQGIFMSYFKPEFFNTLSISKELQLSQRLIKFLNLQKIILQKKQNQNSKMKHRSKLQIVFEEYLNQFGFVFERNINIGPYQIDFLIGNKIIVQLNGNHHYCSNNSQKLNQRQKYRHKILQNNGYFIVDVSINNWVSLIKSSSRTVLEERLKYTCQLIETKYIQYLTKQEANLNM